MLRVFSPTGFNVIFAVIIRFWITDFRDYWISRSLGGRFWLVFGVLSARFWIRIYRISRIKENVFVLVWEVIRRDAMLRVFSPTGTNVNFAVIIRFWIRIYRIFRIRENVFVLGWEVIRRDAMLRVFSPTGFNVNFAVIILFWIIDFRDLQDFQDYCRGELHSPSHDTGAFPYLRYYCRIFI